MRKLLLSGTFGTFVLLFLCHPIFAQSHRFYVAEKTASGSRLIYTNDDDQVIASRQVDGTVVDMEVDAANGKVIWATANSLYTTDLELSGAITPVSTGLNDVKALTIDVDQNIIYYVTNTPGAKFLYKLNYDGSAHFPIKQFGPSDEIDKMVFSTDQSMIFMTNSGQGRINTFNVTGMIYDAIPIPLSGIFGLTLDDENHKLYFTRSNGSISKIDYITYDITSVYSSAGAISCITLNTLSQELKVARNDEILEAPASGTGSLANFNVPLSGDILSFQSYSNTAPLVQGGNIETVFLDEDFGTQAVSLVTVFGDDNTLAQNLDFKIVEEYNAGLFLQRKITSFYFNLINKQNAYGEAWFVIEAADAEGLKVKDTLFVNVAPVMDPPIIGNLFTYEDHLSDLITVTAVPNDQPQPTHYQVTGISGGVLYKYDGQTPIQNNAFIPVSEAHEGLRFKPSLNSVTNGSFQIQSSTNSQNGCLGGNKATRYIVVTAVNDRPVFTKGADITVPEDMGAVESVNWATAMSPGPADEAGQQLTFELQAHDPGLFSVQPQIDPATGNLVFTTAQDATGTTQLSVWLKDDGNADPPTPYDENASILKIVNITLTPVNDAPVSNDFTFSTPEDTPYPLTYEVFASNFYDVDEDAMDQLRIVALPLNGTLLLDGEEINTGTIPAGQLDKLVYLPDPDFVGNDQFCWKGSDGTVFSQEVGNIFITVTSVDDIPLAKADEYSMNEDETLSGQVLGNDEGLGDQPVLVQLQQAVAHGSLMLNPNGSFTYSPTADYFREDRFTYRVTDADGQNSTAEVTISILPLNDEAPLAVDDEFEMLEDDVLSGVNVLLNDKQKIDRPQVSDFTQPESGTVEIAPDGALTYTPILNFNGEVNFEYTITDADAQSSSAQVIIHVLPQSDDEPLANPDFFETDEDTELTANVLENDIIGVDHFDRVGISSMPAEGEIISFDAQTGEFTYQPAENRYGTVTFSYKILDEDGDADEALVTITVLPVNDSAPLAVKDEISTNEDSPVEVNVMLNDENLIDYPVTVASYTDPENGEATIENGGLLNYIPAQDFNGKDSLTYTITDLDGESSTAWVIIDVLPLSDSVPLAVDDSYETDENVPFSASVMENDRNLVDQPVLVTASTPPQNGALEIAEDGSFTYQPLVGYSGQDSFTYTITDLDGETSMAAVQITVNKINFDPYFTSTPVTQVLEDSLYEYTIVFSDPDSTDTHTLTGLILPDWLSLEYTEGDTTAILSGMPDNSHVGSHEVSLLLSDQEGATAEQAFIIEVINANDLPLTVYLLPSEVREGEPEGTLVGRLYTEDVDAGDAHIYALISGEGDSGNGSFTLSGDQLLTAEVFDYQQQDVYSIRVHSTDSEGETVEEILTVTILDVNTTPEGVSLTNHAIEENQPEGTLVGVLFTNDADEQDTHTYHLTQGDGDTDNQWFRISNDSLFAVASFNYEQKVQYSIRLQVKDNRNAVYSKAVNIDIIDINDDPTDILLSSESIIEEIPAGTFIGKLTTTDEDTWDFHTYRLAQGDGDTDNAFFQVSSDSLFSHEVFNYGLQDEYSIRIRSTDSSASWVEKMFTITVEPDPTLDLVIPTAFTPNQDGENDAWEIGKVASHKLTIVEVYNRLGQKVFFSENYVAPWDGNYRGEMLPADTYYYVISLPDSDKTYKGSVMIIRD